jgi:hypothetical protein
MDPNDFSGGQPAVSAPRVRKRNRRQITDPDLARRYALAVGLSPEEAEQAARQAMVNAGHARRQLHEEEDRMVERRRKSRQLFGLSQYED